MTTKQWIEAVALMVMGSLSIAACQQQLGNYQPIPGIDNKVNSLGREIARCQRNEVWTGGNEYTGAYTWDHLARFHSRGGAKRIAEGAREDRVFREGVTALRQLPIDKQNEILESWSKPIDPTWRQTGEIGNGTTDAGKIAEREIAVALTELVRDMLKSTNEKLK